ncbi:MAG: transketolase C-terminal domain-containing protein [Candidatus Micrarchaeia archaeon]
MIEMHLQKDLFGTLEKKPTRDGFGIGLLEMGKINSNLWVLTADVSESTRTHLFAKEFPQRFVQVGVSEQNMAGVGAGIAASGKVVVISAYGVFSPGRNWDQIRVSICYNDVPVIIHGSHTGLTVGPDGASHQALEDIAITRVLPNMVVICPSDFNQAKKATMELIKREKPAYIRSAREKTPVFTSENTPFEIGKANIYREGTDAYIIACGVPVYESLKAANELEKNGISVGVVDCHTIKPIDRKTIIDCASKTKLLISVEDHQINGGLGSAISEVLTDERLGVKLRRHGIYDIFCESGEPYELLKKYGLDCEGIKKVILEELKK